MIFSLITCSTSCCTILKRSAVPDKRSLALIPETGILRSVICWDCFTNLSRIVCSSWLSMQTLLSKNAVNCFFLDAAIPAIFTLVKFYNTVVLYSDNHSKDGTQHSILGHNHWDPYPLTASTVLGDTWCLNLPFVCSIWDIESFHVGRDTSEVKNTWYIASSHLARALSWPLSPTPTYVHAMASGEARCILPVEGCLRCFAIEAWRCYPTL